MKQYIKQQIENKKTILSNISEKDSDNVKNAIDNINVEIKELEKVLNKIEA